MKLLQNERGSVLTYVLLTILILMIAAPVMLSSLSTNQLANAQTSHNKTANDFALSAMEAFIQYLEAYDTYGRPHDISRLDYFNSYGDGVVSGWGTRTFTTPDGTSVTFSQLAYHENTNQLASIPISDEKRYDVVFTATVNQHSKSVRFNISAYNEIEVVPDNKTIDPENKVPLTGSGVLHTVSSDYGNSVKNETIVPAISGYMTEIKNTVASTINGYLDLTQTPTLKTCQSCTVNMIKDLIAQGPANTPVYIKIPGTFSFDKFNQNNEDTWLGSSSKPVILIADNYFFENSNLKMYGSLISNQTTLNPSTGNLTGKNNVTITLRQGNGSKFGNLWVEGEDENQDDGNYKGVTLDNATLSIANSFYAGSVYFKNDATVAAKEFTVDGNLNLQNNANISASPGIMSAGSIEVKNNGQLTASSGDIFVLGDFDSKNNINVTTGGVLAVGGSIKLINNATFATGRSNPPVTSLNLSKSGSPSPSNTPSSPIPWNPSRR